MSTHIAKAKVVKVAIGSADGNQVARIIRRGDVIPGGVESDLLKSLVERGLIEEVAAAFPEGDPTESWKVEELKAYAEAKKIDVSSAKNKGELFELVKVQKAD